MKKNYSLVVVLFSWLIPATLMAQVANFNITGNPAKCRGVAYQFTNTSTNATTFSWDFGDGSSTSTDQNPTHAYTQGGTYIVTLTASNGVTQNVVRKGVYVKEVPNAYYGWFGYNDFFPGDVIQFKNYSTRGVSFLWDFSDGTTSTAINPKKAFSTPGTKLVQITAYNGCGDSSVYSQQIIIVDTATAQPSANGYISAYVSCPNKPISFYNYSTNVDYVVWYFGDGNTLQTELDETEYLYTQKGVYDVKLYAHYRNKIDSASFTITISDTLIEMPYSDISPRRYVNNSYIIATCPGKSFELYSNPSEQTAKAYWKLHDGSFTTGKDTVISFANAGEYDVWFFAENECGAKDSAHYTLYVLNSDTFTNYFGYINVSPSMGYVCPGGKMEFNVYQQQGFEYRWSINDSVVGTGNTIAYTFPNTAQMHTVKVNITPQCGVEDSLSRNVFTSNQANPIASFDVQLLENRANCYKDTVKAFTDYYNEYLLNPVTHFWDFGDGHTDTATAPKHVYATPGWHTIIHRTTNSCGVSETDAITLHMIDNLAPVPTFYANPNQACQGDPFLFDNFTEGADSTIIDYGDGNRTTIIGQSFPHQNHAYSTAGTYTVRLFVHNRCGGDSSSVQVTVLPKPTARITMGDTTVRVGTQLTFNQNISDAVRHVWYRSSNLSDTSTAQSITVTYNTVGVYKVYLYSENATGCFAVDSVMINVTLPGSVSTIAAEKATVSLYPNPTHKDVTLNIELEKQSNVSVALYDINGRLVSELHNGVLATGINKIQATTENIKAGVYICIIKINDSVTHQKFIKQ